MWISFINGFLPFISRLKYLGQMRCQAQFCYLHFLPGVLPPEAKLLRCCFPNPALWQPKPVICNNRTLHVSLHSLRDDWSAHVDSQPVPGSEQLTSLINLHCSLLEASNSSVWVSHCKHLFLPYTSEVT